MGDREGDATALDAYKDSRDAEEMFEESSENVSIGTIVNLGDALFGESDEEEDNSWWGFFKSGIANSGSDRKGERGRN